MTVKVENIPIGKIRPDPDQPRKDFDPQAMEELKRSLRHNGLLQPIIVRPDGDGYIIIAGERRWRAARDLGWETIPAIVRDDVSLEDAAKLQLLENIARKDLNPVEEAKAYKRFLDQGYTPKDISEIVGKDPGYITWLVKILNCREEILHLVAKGKIKTTLAWHLARLSPNGQMRALRKLTSEDMPLEQAVAICDAIYAEENQMEMFPETKLTEKQMEVARKFRSAFEKAVKALEELQEVENKNPGALGEVLATEIDAAEEKVKLLIKHLEWLLKALRRKRARMEVEGWQKGGE